MRKIVCPYKAAIPKSEIVGFIKLLAPYSREIHLTKNQRFIPEKQNVYILIDGRLGVLFAGTEKLLDYVSFGMPLGLLGEEFPMRNIFYKAATTVKICEISSVQLEEIHLNCNGYILKILLKLSVLMFDNMLELYQERCAGNGYSTIILLVKRYHRESVTQEKLVSYILKRTSLSRGYIHSVLANLKASGYILMERGRLVNISFPSPKNASVKTSHPNPICKKASTNNE